MARGPQGQERPGNVVAGAVAVAKIATGEAEDNVKSGRVKSGKAGGRARAESLSKEERSEIAKKAAKSRWHDGA